MRTVKVDGDHVASYEKSGRKQYAYSVVHQATSREVCRGLCATEGENLRDSAIASQVATSARLALIEHALARRAKSEAFARGEAVVGAPAAKDVPPLQRAQMAAGGLEVSAAMPVRMIRDAYNQARSNNEWCTIADQEKRALTIGREVLIGATDAQILKLARGEATLEGSLRTGVVYKELP